MKQHPILFSSPMVKALLAGTKTQTRRVIKKPERYGGIRDCDFCCPYGQPGDRLWVRETFNYANCDGSPSDYGVHYKADDTTLWWVDNAGYFIYPIDEKLHPSIFMPRWASRITLEITDVRVQKVQEISEDDAVAEGCKPTKWGIWWQGYRDMGEDIGLMHQESTGEKPPEWMIEPHKMSDKPWLDRTAKSEYQWLWDYINGKKYPWASNPWVWALTFKVINKQGGNE